jgi:peptide chain release factor 1
MAVTDTLISKLDDLDNRFTAVGRQMEDPAIASDGLKFVALAKEHASLSKIVARYRAYKALASQLQQALAILDDPAADPEFKDLAREEADPLKHQTEAALDEVKGILVMSDQEQIDSVMLELRAGTGC